MRKIDYCRIERTTFETDYRNIFSSQVSVMNSLWPNLRDDLRHKSSSPNPVELYPDDIDVYFTMPYSKLVDVYIDYHQIMGNNSNPNYPQLHQDLKSLFNYSGSNNGCGPMQPLISEFFMRHSENLGIHVCFYCETAYINSFGFSSSFNSFSDFLMTASKEQLRHSITKSDGSPCSNKTINKVIDLRTNSSLTNIESRFNNLNVWHNPKIAKSRQLHLKLKNHFDLDHFLPKSECPLVGLSLFNLVPSCSVCNEKLKRADRLGGTDRNNLLLLSPSSNVYDFDGTARITIIPHNGTSMIKTRLHQEDYRLEFLHPGVYQGSVSEFALEERYNYHKCEALRLFDLYQEYSPAKIKMLEIMFLFSKTKDDIMDDIFGESFSKEHNRCFDKMKRDIRALCGR